ncbi:universal stress protein [Chitinophaga japonensis]|uniref:Nucleotide-binding universal stress UspA family protein n=1 Tax=Chitinophaga japonensis TaxID=104662 RepID=A0A562STP1_CHIJA|nr:universal stress protein [Chitinophaga japonensis]TWI84110.1 hypothetical protein LX66_4472 [Chitinophaga japonensis]
MKKILLAFDGTQFSQGAFEFARRLHEAAPILLTGAFLPQVDFSAAWSYIAGDGPLNIPTVEPATSEKVAANILQFESLCKANNIDFRTHKHFHNLALAELRKETRFADLLVLGCESFFGGHTGYLTDMLHDAECPTVVVPEQFRFPEQLVLAYDGSASSVFAIRQFACVLPELCRLPATLVYAGGETAAPIPDEDYITELAARHFSDLEIMNLELPANGEFASWLNRMPAALLVAGAFGRSLFSQAFHESFAGEVVDRYATPVFIAHK